MGITITFYVFYVIPSYSNDMEAITSKSRIKFKPLLIIGIVTLGWALCVVLVLWAFELEKHGKSLHTVGREESLGARVLGITVLAFALPWIDGAFSVVASCALGAWGTWLLQREINLYAPTAS